MLSSLWKAKFELLLLSHCCCVLCTICTYVSFRVVFLYIEISKHNALARSQPTNFQRAWYTPERALSPYPFFASGFAVYCIFDALNNLCWYELCNRRHFSFGVLTYHYPCTSDHMIKMYFSSFKCLFDIWRRGLRSFIRSFVAGLTPFDFLPPTFFWVGFGAVTVSGGLNPFLPVLRLVHTSMENRIAPLCIQNNPTFC